MSAFEHLTDLRLSLSCTHDFVELSSTIPDALLSRLHHLFLAITDDTGPSGLEYYLHWCNEVDDGDDNYPSSNL